MLSFYKGGISNSMQTILEVTRVLFILFIFSAIGGVLLNTVYKLDDGITNAWLGGIGILFLVFILYRNKLQFSGWYKGKGRKKLPSSVTYAFTLAALLLFVAPFIIK